MRNVNYHNAVGTAREQKMGKYDNMIDMPRPEPRKRMGALERAAQFAPFAALTGYGESVEEAARIVGERIELSEDEKERLDRNTKKIREFPEKEIAVTYFIADSRKQGGAYCTKRGFVRWIDEAARVILMSDGGEIPLDDLYDIDFSDEQHTDTSHNQRREPRDNALFNDNSDSPFSAEFASD